jgi:Domain of unknown function (DUF4337)
VVVTAVIELKGRVGGPQLADGFKHNATLLDDNEGVVATVEQGQAAAGIVDHDDRCRVASGQPPAVLGAAVRVGQLGAGSAVAAGGPPHDARLSNSARTSVVAASRRNWCTRARPSPLAAIAGSPVPAAERTAPRRPDPRVCFGRVTEDVDVGTDRLQDQIKESRQLAHRGRPRWLDALAVSTALFAVFAAIAALESGNYANEALYAANQAVLRQTQAVDTWSQYQAESLKKYQQQTLGTLLLHTGGSPEELRQAQAEADRRQQQQDELRPEADRLAAETAQLNHDSEADLAHHHRFAASVTLFQVAIGLAAIAALLALRWLWLVSLGAGTIGLLALINGFTLTV